MSSAVDVDVARGMQPVSCLTVNRMVDNIRANGPDAAPKRSEMRPDDEVGQIKQNYAIKQEQGWQKGDGVESGGESQGDGHDVGQRLPMYCRRGGHASE